MGQGPKVITVSQCLSQDRAHHLQPALALTMRIFRHQEDFSLSLGMGMPPTKDAIMNLIMPQGLDMEAEMTLILATVNKVTLIPGSGSLGMCLLWWGIRTLQGCIQSVVPRRPTSRILFQPPVHQACSQRVDTLGLWGLHLFPHHSAQKMS